MKLSRDENIDAKAELTLEQISWLKQAIQGQFTLLFQLSTLLEDGTQFNRCYNVFKPDDDLSSDSSTDEGVISNGWVLPDSLEDEYVSYNYSVDK